MFNEIPLKNKLKLYYLTTVFSFFFAVVGFGYNAWRLEVSEENNSVRTAAFEVLIHLAEFEQVVFAAHYDQDKMAGNPRLAWVKIGLVADLSVLINPQVEAEVMILKSLWAEDWQTISDVDNDIRLLTEQIDVIRLKIKKEIKGLE